MLTLAGGLYVGSMSKIGEHPADRALGGFIHVSTSSTQAAGTVVRVQRDAEDIMEVVPEKEYQSLVISSVKLLKGAAYDVLLGGPRMALVAEAGGAPATPVAVEGAEATDPGVSW